jgi:glycosyltransferase involved in cell wall biosynthesis
MTLASIARMRRHAARQGLSTELVMVLDRADSETEAVVRAHPECNDHAQVVAANYGQLGLSRNAGVRASQGRIICIVDGDDYFGENWIEHAVDALGRFGDRAIVRPEMVVSFGAYNHYAWQVDQKDAAFDVAGLLCYNYWTSWSASRRETYERIPYQSTNAVATGFGYEDWHWNCETIAGGYEHRTVEKTVAFYRRKKGGLLAVEAQSFAIIRASALFEPKRAQALLQKPLRANTELGALLGRSTGHVEEEPLSSNPALPAWVVEEMKQISRAVDPQLFPDAAFLALLKYYAGPPATEGGRIYARLVASLSGEKYTHCYILPWLKRGGADLGALHYIKTVSDIPGTRILVILTEKARSPWLTRLPESVDCIELGNAASELALEKRAMILMRLLIQFAPPVIHNINSRLAWEVIYHHGNALRQFSRIFVSLFCNNYTAEGIPVGYAQEHLPRCYQHVTQILSDNATFPHSLREQFGLPERLFQTIYFPTSVPKEALPRASAPTRRILWAGRLDRQKRPDLVAKIAAQLPDCRFLVFGHSLLAADDAAVDALQALPNVDMKGEYDGFSSLPYAECDLLLYTSQWDGLPNVVLEACAHGLPVVASDVGGVSEVISENTGYLVTPFDSVPDFVANIRRALDHADEASTRAVHALALIKERHSFSAFAHSLSTIDGYCEGSAAQINRAGLG